jgi:hypothetical protein
VVVGRNSDVRVAGCVAAKISGVGSGDVIKSAARESNLLALNATIEVAKASG